MVSGLSELSQGKVSTVFVMLVRLPWLFRELSCCGELPCKGVGLCGVVF